MKKQNPHFYGIQYMEKNPLAVDLKQKLSRLLFLHPDYSGEKAARVARNISNAKDAQNFIACNEDELLFLEQSFLQSLFFAKLETWFEHHALPTYEELEEIAVFFGRNVCTLIFELQLKLRLHYSPKEKRRLELLQYSELFNDSIINEILDRYIDSRNMPESEVEDYLIDFYVFDERHKRRHDKF